MCIRDRYFLHQKNCYERGIDEEDFQDEFKIWCEEKMESCPDGVKCKKALRTLRKYKVIDIEDGKIYLEVGQGNDGDYNGGSFKKYCSEDNGKTWNEI